MTDFVLMPEEATPEMEQAAERYWYERRFKALSDDPRTWKGVYAAMRSAAPTMQSENVESVWMYKGSDGEWKPFMNEQHRLNTIADGGWDVREFFATPNMQGEPVSAQVRYRRPEKGQPGWSVWQPAAVMLDRPSWEIDSQGWEVEYRLLYTAPQPSPDVTKLVEALEELIDLMEDIRQGEYTPDSFTTQPAHSYPTLDAN